MKWRNVNLKETEKTRNYIKTCEKFWNVFNDPKPLSMIEDTRISQLDEVMKYFEDWKSWLCTQYKTAIQFQYFISWQTKFDLEVQCMHLCLLCFSNTLLGEIFIGKQTSVVIDR